MDAHVALKPKLTRLKLSGIFETFQARLDQAQKDKWSYSQFLDFLLSDEVERRDHKQLTRRLAKSGLDPEKTLETFTFSFNPKIHEPTNRELATCRFLAKRENCFFLGHSGVGKVISPRPSATRRPAGATSSSTAVPSRSSSGSTRGEATGPMNDV